MQGYIGVFDHPFHAVTGIDGAFSLADVPVGEWEVAAWHGELGEKTLGVKVETGKTHDVAFEFAME
jgi:hypothetical protein